ncbi:hypothetical protein DAEQUDRAFT_769475 [Daedalea quercina L-15889]|uniref:DUF6533 domain-containing protein n=1 Tax=Daedalea quercina L-15889 TaxID=1314783 RepID=A0A165LPE0_9APHY|nr:hypothetical protein DAEQUDRAFT_769475 [Daedalea quercina L-15889]
MQPEVPFSDPTPPSNTDYVAAAACTALLCYDYLICLDREIPLIWTRKLSLTSAFYVLCRYSMMVYTLLTWTPVSDELTYVSPLELFHAS